MLTNNHWVIRPRDLERALGIERLTLINDFVAIGHCVAQIGAEDFLHLAGPKHHDLPAQGTITICGPGTGLGVALLIRSDGGYQVIETEGGHMGFAPLDAFEDRLATQLRQKYSRVSNERVASGPAIVEIFEALAGGTDDSPRLLDPQSVWASALKGSDPAAIAALDRFCAMLGAIAGDLALAQGATGVVIAGGMGYRLRDHLASSRFAERFVAKGRFRALMEAIPVKLIIHPEPGLHGAASAFAQEHAR